MLTKFKFDAFDVLKLENEIKKQIILFDVHLNFTFY